MSPEQEEVLTKVDELVASLPDHEKIGYIFILHHREEAQAQSTTNLSLGAISQLLDEASNFYEDLYEQEGEDI